MPSSSSPPGLQRQSHPKALGLLGLAFSVRLVLSMLSNLSLTDANITRLQRKHAKFRRAIAAAAVQATPEGKLSGDIESATEATVTFLAQGFSMFVAKLQQHSVSSAQLFFGDAVHEFVSSKEVQRGWRRLYSSAEMLLEETFLGRVEMVLRPLSPPFDPKLGPIHLSLVLLALQLVHRTLGAALVGRLRFLSDSARNMLYRVLRVGWVGYLIGRYAILKARAHVKRMESRIVDMTPLRTPRRRSTGSLPRMPPLALEAPSRIERGPREGHLQGGGRRREAVRLQRHRWSVERTHAHTHTHTPRAQLFRVASAGDVRPRLAQMGRK